MGDQVGLAVGGRLLHVPYQEFERVRALPVTQFQRVSLFAALCRINTLYMIARAGSGHIGSSFSSLDIMSWLTMAELRTAGTDATATNDVFFSSKGHDAPGLYSCWIGLGLLDYELIHQLRRLNGLPGHPDVSIPNVVTNSGSLGMGVSKAKGIIAANRLQGRQGRVFVLTGDGELQEGQFWESLISAANHRLEELTLIVDHNKLQSDTLVSKVSDLGDLEGKLRAFGWHVISCDGNSVEEVARAIEAGRAAPGQPRAIIAHTIKGKGVSFMEHTSIDSDVELYKFHSGAPTEDAYGRAVNELIDSANALLAQVQAAPLALATVTRPSATPPASPQRLVAAYSNALIDQARRNPNVVALDADLILDTGLIPFKSEFPSRFIECGIAEQDMVSQAGGLALRGMLPVVHSFACFLSARPNEQIYTNATERTKIVYVASLAGVVPGGPGHSHQAVRDISSLAAVPGLTMVEPSCEAEVPLLLDWALNRNPASSYLRLASVPWPISFTLPSDYTPVVGQGVALTEGHDAAVIAYGPVMLSMAVEAAAHLRETAGLAVSVINLPWLNVIDADWLATALRGVRVVVSIDNHYRIGAQGDRIASAMSAWASAHPPLHRLAIESIPVCGTNPEVLGYHGLDARGISGAIHAAVAGV